MTWWVHQLYSQGQYAELLSRAFWVLFAITLHELAHGWAAIRQGDDTPIRYRRMTLNPLVHMGGMSLIMFALIGIAWGVMPVDPSKFRWKRRGRIIVAGAGPAMNLLLAFIALTAAAFWLAYGPRQNDALFNNFLTFLMVGGWLNILLALFNLLPFPPLDGSEILSGMSLTFYRWYQNPMVQQVGFFVLLAIFLSGIGWVVGSAAQTLAIEYISAVLKVLPQGSGNP